MFQEKQEGTHKKNPRNPMAHQLQIGRYSAKDSLDNQEDTDVSESKDSFCPQMQIKKSQADQESCDTEHLEFALQSEALW